MRTNSICHLLITSLLIRPQHAEKDTSPNTRPCLQKSTELQFWQFSELTSASLEQTAALQQNILSKCQTIPLGCSPEQLQAVQSFVWEHSNSHQHRLEHNQVSVPILIDYTAVISVSGHDGADNYTMRASPIQDINSVAALHCVLLQLSAEECQRLQAALPSQWPNIKGWCPTNAEPLPATSPVTRHIDNADGFYWSLALPSRGHEYQYGEAVPVELVLTNGTVSIDIADLCRQLGEDIYVAGYRNHDDRWEVHKCLGPYVIPGGAIQQASRHKLVFQIFDAQGYAMSSRLGSTFVLREALIPANTMSPTATRWYSSWPDSIYTRAQVLYATGHMTEAANTCVAAKVILGPQSMPPALVNLVPRPEPCRPHPSMQFITYPVPAGAGMCNNQMVLMDLMALANLSNRTLILPLAPEGLHSARTIPLSSIYDIRHMQRTLAGFVCIMEWDEVGSPQDVVNLEADMVSPLEWYVTQLEALAGRQVVQVVPLVYPTMVLRHQPHIQRQMRSSLRLSPTLMDLANYIAETLNDFSKGSGYTALHLRTEVDWKEHCRRADQIDLDGKANWCWHNVSTIWDKLQQHPVMSTVPVIYVAASSASPDVAAVKSLALQSGQKVLTKQDILPSVTALPYLKGSALDFEVCRQASALIGSSVSSFDNELAHHMHAAGKLLYIYNSPAGVIQQRTDGGQLEEPEDVVLEQKSSWYWPVQMHQPACTNGDSILQSLV